MVKVQLGRESFVCLNRGEECACADASGEMAKCPTCEAWWPREELLVGMGVGHAEDNGLVASMLDGATYCPECGPLGLIEETHEKGGDNGSVV
jgi:hypothetical protein